MGMCDARMLKRQPVEIDKLEKTESHRVQISGVRKLEKFRTYDEKSRLSCFQ